MLRRLRQLVAFGATTLGALALAGAAPPVVKTPPKTPAPSASIAKPAPKKFVPKKPVEPPLPAPHVTLHLEPRAQNAWVVSIVNDDSVPLQIVADARLLELEIEPPPEEDVVDEATAKKAKKKKTPEKPLKCALPTAMRSDERTLILPPGRRYLEAIDPRLYCLDAWKKIVAGTKITAHLGWTPPKQGSAKPPFVVRAPPADADRLASLKEIVAEPVTVTETTVPKLSSSPTSGAKKKGAVKPLVAHGGAAESVMHGKTAQVTLHLENAASEAVRVYARPQLVAATVRSPRGIVTTCDGWARPAPIVDFVVKLAPKGKWSATVLLASICPEGTFDLPGLYEVTPRLHADPVPWEPKAFVGEVVADTPQLLRIEEGEKPFHDVPPLPLDTSE